MALSIKIQTGGWENTKKVRALRINVDIIDEWIWKCNLHFLRIEWTLNWNCTDIWRIKANLSIYIQVAVPSWFFFIILFKFHSKPPWSCFHRDTKILKTIRNEKETKICCEHLLLFKLCQWLAQSEMFWHRVISTIPQARFLGKRNWIKLASEGWTNLCWLHLQWKHRWLPLISALRGNSTKTTKHYQHHAVPGNLWQAILHGTARDWWSSDSHDWVHWPSVLLLPSRKDLPQLQPLQLSLELSEPPIPLSQWLPFELYKLLPDILQGHQLLLSLL